MTYHIFHYNDFSLRSGGNIYGDRRKDQRNIEETTRNVVQFEEEEAVKWAKIALEERGDPYWIPFSSMSEARLSSPPFTPARSSSIKILIASII